MDLQMSLHEAARNGNESAIESLIQNGGDVNIQDKEDERTPLHDAARSGHVNCIALLIQNGANVDVHNADGRTPLHYLAIHGHEKCMEVLILNGATVDSQNANKRTPLQLAARNGHEKCIELLIQNGANVNAQDKVGSTPLHYAASNGHDKSVELLIQNGANLDTQEKDGSAPLHFSASRGYEKCVESLLRNGANADVQDQDGTTPLHYAARNGHEQCVEIVTQNGANVDVQDKVGSTPLHLAASNGHDKCIELLIQKGANIDAQNADQRTPLHYAALNGHEKCIKLLIQKSGNIGAQEKDGRTPLHDASSKGHEKCIELLIRSGANIDGQDMDGRTPLHHVAIYGHEHCIEVLIRNGATVDSQNANKRTPLHYAARNGYEKCIELLVQNDAQVNAQDKVGSTPLHYAAASGYEKCVELLLQNGASVDSQERNGAAPLHSAARSGNEKCVELLIQNRASVDVQEKDGSTPLHYSASTGHEKCVELLIRKGANVDVQDQVGKTPLHYYPGGMAKFAQSYISQESLPKNLLPLYDLLVESIITGNLELDDSSLGLNDEDLDAIPWSQISPFLTNVLVNQREVTSLPIGLAYLSLQAIEQIHFVVSENWKRLDKLKAGESPKRIIEFCKAKLEGGVVKLKALRLMVMGGPAVGKTSMVRRLRGGAGHNMENIPLSTDGVELADVKLGNGTSLETWDFGGQKIYRVSHQLFLRDCCIFAVVCRVTDPTDVALKELQFWIDSILSRSEGSEVARVVQIVLVTTHGDRLKSKEAELAHERLHKSLLHQYGAKNISSHAIMLQWVGKSATSSLLSKVRDPTIKELKRVLLEVSNQVAFDVPASLELIMESLNSCGGGSPIVKISIVHEVIQKVGEQKGVKALQDEERRLGFLKDLDKLGYIYLVRQRRMLSRSSLSFSGTDTSSTEMAVVLRPQWISRLLATLITTKHSFAQTVAGIIDYDTLTLQLWRDEKKFPEQYHEDMINLLVQLHIMFPLRPTISQQQKKKRYFIPCLLKEDEPQHVHGIEKEFGSWGNQSCGGGQNQVVLNRILRMKNRVSVPVAVMPMVIVQLMNIGEVIECWQQGCVVTIYPLDDPAAAAECCCLVKRKCSDELYIKLGAMKSEVAGWWMKEVMRSLENMLEEFYHVDYEVEVVYQGEGTGGVSCYPACLFSLDHLYKIAAQRKVTALCQNETHNVGLQYLVPDLLVQEASSLSIVSWNDLEVEEELGKGAFGRVLLCSSSTNFQQPVLNEEVAKERKKKKKKKKKKKNVTPSRFSSSLSSSSSSSPSVSSLSSTESIPSMCVNCTRKEVGIFCAECEDETFLCCDCSQTLHFSRKRKHHSPTSIVNYFQEKEREESSSLLPLPSLPPSPLSLSRSPKRERKEGKKFTKFEYAAKVLEPKEMENEEKLQKDFLLEVYVMTGLSHPNIVRLVGIAHPLKCPRNDFHGKHAMVMEVVGGGDLFENIHFIMGMNIPAALSDVIKIVETYQSKLTLHKSDPGYYPAPSAPLPPLSLLCDGGFEKIKRSFEKWLSVAGESYGDQINELKEIATTGITRMYDGNFEGTTAQAVSKESKKNTKKIKALLHETAAIYAPLPWILRLKIAFDLAQGIHYLHSHNPPIIHRDLKSLNVLLSRLLTSFPISEEVLKEPLAKVADFGWSVKLLGASSLIGGEHSKIEHITPLWVSPEVLSGQEYTEKADIYAIGIILWELLTREIPFSLDLNLKLTSSVIGYVYKKKRPSIPPSILRHENENNPAITKKYLALMNQCWDHQPSARPSALQICESLYEMMQDDEASSLLRKVVDETGNLDRLREENAEVVDLKAVPQPLSLVSLTKMVVSDMLPPLKIEETKWRVKRIIFSGLDWIWIGFWNGYIGAIEVKKAMDGTPKVTLCHEKDKHEEEVRAMVYQSVGGNVWTSSMCGTLQVWKGAPLTYDNTIEHFNMKGWLKKVGKLWGEDVWVSLDTGRLRFFKFQYHGTEEDSMPIDKDTVVKSSFSDRKCTFQIHSPSQNKTFKFTVADQERMIVSPPLSQWVSAFEQFCRMLSLPLSLLHLAVKRPDNKGSDSSGVGILGLEAVRHSVWGYTTTFEVVEFVLVTGEDEHGLNRTSRIETKRVLKLDQSDIDPRFQNVGRAGLVSVGKNALCLAIGSSVGTIQIQIGGVASCEELSAVEWCGVKDRGSSYFRCLVSVWNENWNATCPSSTPSFKKERQEGSIRVDTKTTTKQGPELWAYDGEKILIFRLTAALGAAHAPSSPRNLSSLVLVDEIEVVSAGFLSCLTQVGPNEVWGGTAASGIVMGWEIDTRSLLPHYPLGEENAHDGNVSCLATPGQMSNYADHRRSITFSGSNDGSLRMFCLKRGEKRQKKGGEKWKK